MKAANLQLGLRSGTDLFLSQSVHKSVGSSLRDENDTNSAKAKKGEISTLLREIQKDMKSGDILTSPHKSDPPSLLARRTDYDTKNHIKMCQQ